MGRHYTKFRGVGQSCVLNVVTKFDVKALRGFRGNLCVSIVPCFNRPGSPLRHERLERPKRTEKFAAKLCERPKRLDALVAPGVDVQLAVFCKYSRTHGSPGALYLNIII